MTQEQITALLLALVALENSRDGIGDEVARLAHEHQSTLELYGLRATPPALASEPPDFPTD